MPLVVSTDADVKVERVTLAQPKTPRASERVTAHPEIDAMGRMPHEAEPVPSSRRTPDNDRSGLSIPVELRPERPYRSGTALLVGFSGKSLAVRKPNPPAQRKLSDLCARP